MSFLNDEIWRWGISMLYDLSKRSHKRLYVRTYVWLWVCVQFFLFCCCFRLSLCAANSQPGKKYETKRIATNFIYTLFGGNGAILQRTTRFKMRMMLFYIKFYLYYFRENFFFRCCVIWLILLLFIFSCKLRKRTSRARNVIATKAAEAAASVTVVMKTKWMSQAHLYSMAWRRHGMECLHLHSLRYLCVLSRWVFSQASERLEFNQHQCYQQWKKIHNSNIVLYYFKFISAAFRMDGGSGGCGCCYFCFWGFLLMPFTLLLLHHQRNIVLLCAGMKVLLTKLQNQQPNLLANRRNKGLHKRFKSMWEVFVFLLLFLVVLIASSAATFCWDHPSFTRCFTTSI